MPAGADTRCGDWAGGSGAAGDLMRDLATRRKWARGAAASAPHRNACKSEPLRGPVPRTSRRWNDGKRG